MYKKGVTKIGKDDECCDEWNEGINAGDGDDDDEDENEDDDDL